jgi:capsular polysaccharide biosynthesis protein
VLTTLGSDETYRSSDEAYRFGEPALGAHYQQSINLADYLNILRRRFFYFLVPFGLISILGLYLVAIQKPTYLSEGKILLQPQVAPDISSPVVTPTASERTLLIQQRVVTRDHLLSVASRFGLFPSVSEASEIYDLMRKRIQIKPLPVELDGQLRPNSRTVSFTAGFEYENPELAMRVANEFITWIVSGDESSRNVRATEVVKLLTSQTKDIEDKLESTQMQILEIVRRPRETIPETAEGQKSQLTTLSALRAELTQKTSVYSDSHPVVTALKKRIATMEKNLLQLSQVPARAQSTRDDDIEALKRQVQALEKQLADANAKLASARLREKLDLEQQERMQVIEAPSLPEKPVKSKRIVMVGIIFAAATMLGIGAAIGPELLNKSIRSRSQLAGVVAGSLVVCIPFIATRADTIRARLRVLFAVIGVVTVLGAWVGLTAAILFHLPVDFFNLTM